MWPARAEGSVFATGSNTIAGTTGGYSFFNQSAALYVDPNGNPHVMILGGQTVGKMATGIRVVAEDDRDVEPAKAIQRTLAALASVATVGIGFAPALFAGDRRTLHDRVAGTRVVGPVHE